MPRPRMIKRIQCQPPVRFYKPQGIPLGQMRGVTLPLEGLEAIRLADAEGLDQEQAAAMMDISRPTFSRLVSEAGARSPGPWPTAGPSASRAAIMKWRMTAPPAARPGAAPGWGADAEAGAGTAAWVPMSNPPRETSKERRSASCQD